MKQSQLPPELLARIEAIKSVKIRFSEFDGWILTVEKTEFIFGKGVRAVRQLQFCITLIEAVLQHSIE